MLVMFTVGWMLGALWMDAAVLAGAGPDAQAAARQLLGMGLLTGLAAAPLGCMDWRRLPKDHGARGMGALRCAGTALALVLWATSWLLRQPGQPAPTPAMGWSLLAGTAVFLAAWLGLEIALRQPSPAQPPLNAPAVLSDLTCSVAGEEDPGAAVDSPAPPPGTTAQYPRPPGTWRRSGVRSQNR